jgi:glycerol-3-phosphate acyltransferase PlsY
VSGDRLGWLLVAASYLAGSIPFGLLLGRLVAGVDVRHAGSGNIGATNVARTAGRGLGVATLLLDVAKGAVAVGATAALLGEPRDAGWPAAAGLAAFLGHVLPPWLGFRGGKGVATGFGAFLVLAPGLALASAVVFGAVLAGTEVVSLGSIGAAAFLAAGAAWTRGTGAPVTRVALVVFLVVLVRHRSNIGRMLRGEESRMRRGR